MASLIHTPVQAPPRPMVGTEPIAATPACEAAFTNHVRALLARTLETTRDVTIVVKGRGRRAARLVAIKADVIGRMQFDLSAKDIAAAHRISQRYLQRLFEQDGTTLTNFVLEARLALAHQMLCNPAHAAQSITAVAAEAGFNDLSYFNRRFRGRYGCTPSEVRAEARRMDAA